MNGIIETISHQVDRLAIQVDDSFGGFIVEDLDDATWFTVDQPSTRFRSFNTPQITKVGLELDHKLAALLEHLDAPVPAALTDG